MQSSRHVAPFPCLDKPGRNLLLAARRCTIFDLSGDLWTRLRAAEQAEMLETFTRTNAEKSPFTALVTLTLECNLTCS